MFSMVIRCLKITIFGREFEAQEITESEEQGKYTQRNLHADLCMQIVRQHVGDPWMTWEEVQLHVLGEIGKSASRSKERQKQRKKER